MIAPFSFSSPVSLVGFMGAGKTAVGTALARRMNCLFLDLDAHLEKRLGMSIAQCFANHGEEFFREHEARLLHETLAETTVRVIATGGGAVIRAENRALIKSRSLCCFLDPPYEVLQERLQHERHTRPLLATQSEEYVRSLWEQRREWYRETAHVIIPDSAPVELLVETLLARVATSIF